MKKNHPDTLSPVSVKLWMGCLLFQYTALSVPTPLFNLIDIILPGFWFYGTFFTLDIIITEAYLC